MILVGEVPGGIALRLDEPERVETVLGGEGARPGALAGRVSLVP
ncbi:hypothetical protein [Nonomuraea sp. KM88]